MRKYIGTYPIDTTNHPEFNHLTQTDWALKFIWMYGQIDGAHHKQWVIDQVTRILNNAPVVVSEDKFDDGQTEYRFHAGTSIQYEEWVKSYQGEFEDGEYEYSYDEGISP